MGFSIELIPDNKQEKLKEKIKDSPVKLENLRLVKVDHYNFEGEIKEGQLIVHGIVAENVINIFQELFKKKFQIHQMKLVDEYNDNDELSMADNNSSCFNYRKIAGSDKFSIHAYGLAIDINPVQNPMLTIDEKSGMVSVHPKAGIHFLNRDNTRPGMVKTSIVELFKEHGFDVWGGGWNNPIDYHHFQVPNEIVQKIPGREAENLN